MEITIVGASGGEVTGSAYYVQTKNAAVLIDCGLFQGGKKSEAFADGSFRLDVPEEKGSTISHLSR
jgi:predicted metal-dependent RNase